MTSLSPQQREAVDAVAAWHRGCMASINGNRRMSQQIMRVFGYAGTGKTTTARRFAEQVNGSVVYAAYTGKAALMMQKSGCVGASTIHSLIYRVEEDDYGRHSFRLNRDSDAKEADLIVIDECSMVDEELARDLLSFRRPILVLGDPAQLTPVKGAGFFTSAEPDVMLTEIHRQAADNPIIQLATAAREGRAIVPGTYGHSRVVRRGTLSTEEVAGADQVLVGLNRTRTSFNKRIRNHLGRGDAGPLPEVDDKLVCLRNDKDKGILNGGLFTVLDAHPAESLVEMTLTSEDFPDRDPVSVSVRREFFIGGAEELPRDELRGTQQFDYGYALTTHKAQGSQWGGVIAYDESSTFRAEAKRWLYTAITRAADRLTLVV
ncbi:ATP-dependent DNA helicase [Paracoccus aerius]|uniref:AAA family ATPase n=1 Tax=Paracoccus aerius TaxID=1915382 RepID=A0ABS1S6A6_9RHOB|nr:AAA family ATPase [Paracoccus aerius]MBL3674270.1 AAA family ATPase [Paracoccus aerius]GHG24496.1 ATP-binding protein [Paracoccus aerius]